MRENVLSVLAVVVIGGYALTGIQCSYSESGSEPLEESPRLKEESEPIRREFDPFDYKRPFPAETRPYLA